MIIVRNRISEGARNLARALQCRLVTGNPEQPSRQLTRARVVINWGIGNSAHNLLQQTPGRVILNHPAAVAVCSNKLSSLQAIRADATINIPAYLTDNLEGHENDTKDIWIARTILNGSSGAGIVVVRPGDTFPRARLYTKYIRKAAEYRVHVVNGAIIAVTQKRKRSEEEQTADQKLIRSHNNGWVQTINNLDPYPVAANTMAVRALQLLNLDFGAVDLVIENKTGRPVILEVNSAPGLTAESAINAYREAFRAAQY